MCQTKGDLLVQFFLHHDFKMWKQNAYAGEINRRQLSSQAFMCREKSVHQTHNVKFMPFASQVLSNDVVFSFMSRKDQC